MQAGAVEWTGAGLWHCLGSCWETIDLGFSSDATLWLEEFHSPSQAGHPRLVTPGLAALPPLSSLSIHTSEVTGCRGTVTSRWASRPGASEEKGKLRGECAARPG